MEKLIKDIQSIFKDDVINTDDVKHVLQNYKSNPLDWKKYAHFDAHKYTRNLVDIGNGKYNMLILCWGPGMGSSIHDHTNSHCFVKILDGQLLETRYDWPDKDDKDAPLNKIGEDLYERDGVTYMSDELGLHRMENPNELGLHRMENPSHVDGCVSLHLYIPPFDACKIFDERTGRSSKSVVTFFTKYGKKIDYRGSRQGVIKAEEPSNQEVSRSPHSFV
uniref:Cysteine dioxygenase n=1 Tax=Panagrolaimus sp. ES5 TaxID=591445 RepID=A0AC34F744_9BILA